MTQINHHSANLRTEKGYLCVQTATHGAVLISAFGGHASCTITVPEGSLGEFIQAAELCQETLRARPPEEE